MSENCVTRDLYDFVDYIQLELCNACDLPRLSW